MWWKWRRRCQFSDELVMGEPKPELDRSQGLRDNALQRSAGRQAVPRRLTLISCGPPT
jgi:hypothetical protein